MALINEYLNASAAKINIPTPFILKGQAPLDLRQIVQKKENLTLANFYDGDAPFWYPGMLVSCVEDNKVYILKEKVEVDEITQEEVKSYEFVEVNPDLPENATKNTTYDLASVANTEKGQIQLSNSDDTSVDTVSIEGDDSNIKVSSTADGVKVEHTAPTEGTALSANETAKDPGYGKTFTAVTGLTKDDNGHIVAATLEKIQMPGAQDLSNLKTKQTAVADVTASGEATTAVTRVTQNENGEITVTKANLPSVTDAAVEGKYVSSVTQTNGKIAVTRAALPVVDVQYNGATIVEDAVAKLEKVVDTTVTADSANLITSGAVEAYVKAIGTVMEFKGVVAALPVLPSDLYNAGDVVIYDNEEYVLGTDGKWHEIGQVKTDEAVISLGIQADDADFATVNQATGAVVLDFAGAKELISKGDAATLAAAKKYTDDEIEALDATVGSQTVAEGKHVAVEVVETDGVLTGLTVVESDIASAKEVEENAQVTAAALNDLNTRLNNVDTKDRVTVVEDTTAGDTVITKDTIDGVTTLTAHIANSAASFSSATPNGGDYIATAYGVKDYVDTVVCWQEGSF